MLTPSPPPWTLQDPPSPRGHGQEPKIPALYPRADSPKMRSTLGAELPWTSPPPCELRSSSARQEKLHLSFSLCALTLMATSAAWEAGAKLQKFFLCSSWLPWRRVRVRFSRGATLGTWHLTVKASSTATHAGCNSKMTCSGGS